MKRNRFITSLLVGLSAISMSSCLKENANPAEGTIYEIATVKALRDNFKGSDLNISKDVLSGATKISGIVISDHSAHNLPDNYIALQNTDKNGNTRGVFLDAGTEAAGYLPGDSIQVNVEGLTMKSIDGNPVITGVTSDKIEVEAHDVFFAPAQISASALLQGFDAYEATAVQLNGDITPTPQNGETYSGAKHISDGHTDSLILYTYPSADFADHHLPASATFTGLAMYVNGSASLVLRTFDDVLNASGPMYAGFPEDFETPDVSAKSHYDMPEINNNLTLKTGSWNMYQSILGNTAGRDRFNPSGLQCIRMQQQLAYDTYVQMNFDLPNGASKVTFLYGAYYTDASSTLRLEYSTDQGVTWQAAGPSISDASATAKVATYMLNITGPVRFRIVKIGLGATTSTVSNGRLCIDDVTIYSN